MSGSDQKRKASSVGHLITVIDDYKDRTGQPSDASISRAIGVARQTVSNWRTRGIKELPERKTLHKLADLVGRDYEHVVLRAALLDAGWIEEPANRSDDAAGDLAPNDGSGERHAEGA